MLTNNNGKQGAKASVTLILEDGSQAQLEMEILVGLMAADLRVKEARIRGALEHAPADVERRLRIAHQKVEVYREKLQNLPSIEAVSVHAEKCLQEMSWFSRNVFARGIVREVEATQNLKLQDVAQGSVGGESEIPTGYLFWWGEDGNYEVRALPEILTSEEASDNADNSGATG